ncbi:hypothetical protein D082_31660 [Synechocystis sp. PCC 6714]|nr:hypothetical protein D082_31660 [Synechocystis sp. PCC 6714]
MVLINALNISLQEYHKLEKRNIPRILTAFKEQNTDSINCLLEYSEIFSHDMMVSVYYTNQDDIEVLIATGFVKNVQDNGKIMIKLNNLETGQKEILEKLSSNDKSIIGRTIIKPGIPQKIFNQLLFDNQFS